MADHSASGAPALSTNIESGKFDEKAAEHPAPYQPKPKVEDDDEDEDIDALIEDLESHDGHDAVSCPLFAQLATYSMLTRLNRRRRKRRALPVAVASSPRTCSRLTPVSVSLLRRLSSAAASTVSTR